MFNDAFGNWGKKIPFLEWYRSTPSKRTSVGVCSSCKRQNLGVGGWRRRWFNYPHASAHLACEVSCQGLPNRPASSLRLVKRGYLGAEKSCKKTDHSCRVSAAFVACNTQTLYCNLSEERCRRIGPVHATLSCYSFRGAWSMTCSYLRELSYLRIASNHFAR